MTRWRTALLCLVTCRFPSEAEGGHCPSVQGFPGPRISSRESRGQNFALPQSIHVLITRTCEHVTLPSKRDLVEMIKRRIRGGLIIPACLGGPLPSQGPLGEGEGEGGSQSREDVTTGSEVGVTLLLAGGHQARNAGASNTGTGQATFSPGPSRSRPCPPGLRPRRRLCPLRTRVDLSHYVCGHF